MEGSNGRNIDQETINKIGLLQSKQVINAQCTPNARVFEYPGLENIFIMENDLYGNTMPMGSCFLASYGAHGLIGKHLNIETLRNATAELIKEIAQKNSEG